MPPRENEYTFTENPSEEQHRTGTRSVFPLGHAVCSTAYAISNAGAVKMEKQFREGSDNIDLRLGTFVPEQILLCGGAIESHDVFGSRAGNLFSNKEC